MKLQTNLANFVTRVRDEYGDEASIHYKPYPHDSDWILVRLSVGDVTRHAHIRIEDEYDWQQVNYLDMLYTVVANRLAE